MAAANKKRIKICFALFYLTLPATILSEVSSEDVKIQDYNVVNLGMEHIGGDTYFPAIESVRLILIRLSVLEEDFDPISNLTNFDETLHA